MPIQPVPKSYRSFGRKFVLSDQTKKFQIETVRFLEKIKHQQELDTIDGYLYTEYTFFIDRPDSARNMVFPARKPDHDNLVKSFQDCLEMSGIIKNDSRIIDCRTQKLFAGGEGCGGIIQPGILVVVGTID